MKIKLLNDFFAGILFLMLGSFFLIYSFSYSLGQFSEFGPGFYPLIVSGLLICNSLILILKSIKWI